MSRTTRFCLLSGVAIYLIAPAGLAGVDLPQGKQGRAHQELIETEVHPVMIVSKPIGSKVQINGQYVGHTPLVVDFAVDRFGRSIRDIEVWVIPQKPGAQPDVRRFPASDGSASFIPSLLAFDLYIVPVYVVR